MLSEIDIKINLVAQGKDSIDSIMLWYGDLSQDLQSLALKRVHYFCFQSHPRPAEVVEAITKSGLKPTMTPCVVLSKNTINEGLNKIVNLPLDEHFKAFALLVALFSVSDTRRRETDCAGGCSHEWHNMDL